jgi:hypothetical protein
MTDFDKLHRECMDMVKVEPTPTMYIVTAFRNSALMHFERVLAVSEERAITVVKEGSALKDVVWYARTTSTMCERRASDDF